MTLVFGDRGKTRLNGAVEREVQLEAKQNMRGSGARDFKFLKVFREESEKQICVSAGMEEQCLFFF